MAAQIISGKLGPVSSWADLHGATIATAKPFPSQTANADGLTATASGYGILRSVGRRSAWLLLGTAVSSNSLHLPPLCGAAYAAAASGALCPDTVSLCPAASCLLLSAPTGVATMSRCFPLLQQQPVP